MDTATALILVNLVLTAMITLIQTIKLRFQCGAVRFDLRPKDSETPKSTPPHSPLRDEVTLV